MGQVLALFFLVVRPSIATDLGAEVPAAPQVPSAQSAQAESGRNLSGQLVKEIEIEGLKRIEKEAILGKVGYRKGARFDGDVREDIRTIYQLGFFDEVEVFTEQIAGGLKLVFVVRERPVISAVNFEGNERLSDSDLKAVVKTKEWSILDLHRVRQDVDSIQKLYVDKGFFLAKVNYEVTAQKATQAGQPGSDEVKLTFKVQDFDKVEIKRITFLNNRRFTDEQLKGALLQTKEGGFWSFLSGSGNYKEAALKEDLKALTYFYLEHGYIKFRYETPVVTVSEDKKFLFISIYIEEGDVFSMGNIDFGGDLLFPKEELMGELKLKSGDEFKISSRNLDIQRLTEKYQDLGYAFVNTIPKMEVHDDTKKVDVEYVFERGDICNFGRIYVMGNTKTYDDVIRREFRITEGEKFNGTRLRISRERVERLGFFAPGEVSVATVPRKGTTNVVDVEVRVKERSTGTITLGAGYGSGGGFFFNAQIQEINLFGRGQAITLQGIYAAENIQRSLTLGFTDPYAFDTSWSLGGELFYIIFPIPNKYNLRRTGLNLRAGYPITDETNVFLSYKFEGMSIVTKADPAIDSTLDEGYLSSLVWSLIRDKRNNRFETTEGNYQSAIVETAGLGGDKNFIKWSLNNRLYVRLIGDLVFRNSVEFGWIMPVGARGVPPSEKFYLGGPMNMRGFYSYTLGPSSVINNITVPSGGDAQLFGLFELEHPLIREAGLKWVLFFDAGNAFQRFPLTLRFDYGLGFRWFSPIGPLRFEWGFPISPTGTEGSQFWFHIGTPF